MIPLHDRVVVEMEESLSSVIHVQATVASWRDARDQLSNRGRVVSVGPGKRHHKTGRLLKMHCSPGDMIRFSELQYPSVKKDGRTYAVIMDADVVGIERE